MNCTKCGSLNLIEKDIFNSIHKKGVYCGDCEKWVKWGGINNNSEIEKGIHIGQIYCAEEIHNKFILIIVKLETGEKLKYSIWRKKPNNKYNSNDLDLVLKIFSMNYKSFKNLDDFFNFLKGKKVKVEVDNFPKISKWFKYEE